MSEIFAGETVFKNILKNLSLKAILQMEVLHSYQYIVNQWHEMKCVDRHYDFPMAKKYCLIFILVKAISTDNVIFFDSKIY